MKTERIGIIKGGNMIRTTIVIEEEDLEKIRKIGVKDDRSKSYMIRLAVKKYLEGHNGTNKKTKP